MKRGSFAVAAGLALLLACRSASAVTVPSGFVSDVFADSLHAPTAMKFAPDGRLFVLEQHGAVRIVKNGQLLSTPFLQLNVDSNGERGLLGIAFDPGFASNRYIYLYYTRPASTDSAVHNRVVRVRADANNPDVAIAGSEHLIFRLPALSSATNHNGGALLIRNGKLFVAVGENTFRDRAQDLTNVFGKVLRLNLDGTIPTDNPFYNQTTGQGRAIFAYGLRNPFSMAQQPGTKKIFINDVGENTWEEINVARAGANYGWPQTEGPTTQAGIDSPLFAYPHTGTVSGCAIVDGEFYNPEIVKFPQTYVGKYFYADLCSGWVRTLNPETKQSAAFASGFSSPVAIAVNSFGNLFVLQRDGSDNGTVYRIRYQPSANATVPSGSGT
jgi:glucose/arabinose dehydrogenase